MSEGKTLAQIAALFGVSTDTVRRALSAGAGSLRAPAMTQVRGTGRPSSLWHEGAPPLICEGASLRFVGALLILPGLAVTGLLDAAELDATEKVLGIPKAAFYSMRSLLLSLVFVALLGEARAEGLTRMDPVALGRLIGLERAPEVKTIRRRMQALAGLRRSEQVLMALARHHVDAHPEAMGVLYVEAMSAPTTAGRTCPGRIWPGRGSRWQRPPTPGSPTPPGAQCWCGPRGRAPRCPENNA